MNGTSRPKAARTQRTIESSGGHGGHGEDGGMRPAIVSLADRTVWVGRAQIDGPWVTFEARRLTGGAAAGPEVELTVGPAEVRRVRWTGPERGQER